MDLTETEDIKKRWQEYTEELYKKDLCDPDNQNAMDHPPRARHSGMQSQVGLRKPQYEQASGGDGIPVELFQILEEDAMKVLHSICQQMWKPQQWPQDWKSSVFIPIPKKGDARECSNYHTSELISHSSKVMLNILPVRLEQHSSSHFLNYLCLIYN